MGLLKINRDKQYKRLSIKNIEYRLEIRNQKKSKKEKIELYILKEMRYIKRNKRKERKR